MAQDGARLVYHLGKWHLYGFQVRQPVVPDRTRERGQQHVFFDIARIEDTCLPGHARRAPHAMIRLNPILTGMCGSVHRAALTRAGSSCSVGGPYSVSGWPLGNWWAYQVASRCRIVFSLT